MSHLPYAHEDKDDGLSKRPPEHPGIGTVTDQSKPLLPCLIKAQSHYTTSPIVIDNSPFGMPAPL